MSLQISTVSDQFSGGLQVELARSNLTCLVPVGTSYETTGAAAGWLDEVAGSIVREINDVPDVPDGNGTFWWI